MRDVYVIGVGMTRFGKYADRSVRGLAAEAIRSALLDAGIDWRRIEAVAFANSNWGFFSGQHSIKGQVILRDLGMTAIPVVNVENACAGGSTAFHLAWLNVASGLHDCCMALGAEKIFHEDKAKMFESFWGGMDVENRRAHLEMMLGFAAGIDLEVPGQGDAAGAGRSRSPFMDLYSAVCRWHMAEYGTTARQLALIAEKNHYHGSLNPLAQYQHRVSVEEVLAARSVSWPLTLPMCAPVGDGGAAAILCSKAVLKKLNVPGAAVRVLASVLASGSDRAGDEDRKDIGVRLSGQAYERAGLGPEDIDLAEVHDASAFGELHQTEALGFCKFGEGGALAESGTTRLGGRLPVNPSGGLESRGHPIGASGLGQIHELVVQLRHGAGARQVEKCRIALAENGGGNLGFEEAAMGITILERF